jgi:predicted deacylase
LNGAELGLWVHAVHGGQAGPVLALLSTLHGGEWFSIAVLRQVIQETDPASLRGTLLAVPVANPPALVLLTRNMPDESDSPDMNRIFPGPLTWTSDQLNATLTREVLARANVVLDFHVGPFGSTIVRRANVVSGFPGPRSSIGYAGGVLGIPALGVEIGGAGFGASQEDAWQQQSVSGVRAIMAALGMVEHAADSRPRRQVVYSKSHRVNPTRGGFLRSHFGGEALAQTVTRGTLLGEVVSPYTFEVLEELRSPANGLLFYTARDYPIHPGEWAYGVADTDEGARWVDNAATAERVSR